MKTTKTKPIHPCMFEGMVWINRNSIAVVREVKPDWISVSVFDRKGDSMHLTASTMTEAVKEAAKRDRQIARNARDRRKIKQAAIAALDLLA